MLPGGERPYVMPAGAQKTELLVSRQNALHKVMGFTGKSIDDIVNCPIARNIVFGYFKLSRNIDRHIEVVDLERQWNPLGRR